MTALLLLALAAEPVFEAPEPPPATAAQFVWRYQGKDTHLYALTYARAGEIGAEKHACLDRVDELQLQLGQKVVKDSSPSWYWWVLGGVALGAGGALAVRGLK